MESKTPQSASREIKKYLLSIVRNDWEWPPPSGSSATAPEVEPHALVKHGPVTYRERYDGSTDESAEEDEHDSSEEETEKKEFKFESPDSVGGMMERRTAKRKRRRKIKLEEEMTHNEGLRCFVERRNAWTGVLKRDDGSNKQTWSSVDEKDENGTDGTTESSDQAENNKTDEEELPDTDPKLPIPLPLIEPSNPLRAAITPKAYSEIYAKTVHSARTPTVPINLVDMTRALVQGWKENGEWPPRMNAAEPAIASRKSKAHQNGSLEVDEHGISIGEGLLANHPHFKKGVEGVKRVLRLSGSHSHGSHHAAVDGGG